MPISAYGALVLLLLVLNPLLLLAWRRAAFTGHELAVTGEFPKSFRVLPT